MQDKNFRTRARRNFCTISPKRSGSFSMKGASVRVVLVLNVNLNKLNSGGIVRQFVILTTVMLMAYPAQRGLAQPANGNPNPNPTDVVITTAEVTYTANQPNLITI